MPHQIPPQLMPPPELAEIARGVVNNAAGIHEYLNACEQCGLPVDDRRRQLNEQAEFAQAFLRNFFPDVM